MHSFKYIYMNAFLHLMQHVMYNYIHATLFKRGTGITNLNKCFYFYYVQVVDQWIK